jgi:CheY-like chemotaxis protein
MQHQTKRLVLCIEGQSDASSTISSLIELSDLEAQSVKTMAEGLRQARSHHFDLYLIDDRYLDGTGAEFCRQLRQFDPYTPILCCTAEASETERRAAMEAGAQGYITAPGQADGLVVLIHRLIDEWKGVAPAVNI